MRHEFRILVASPERQRPLGKPKSGWKDNNKLNLQGIGCEGVD
jgi:hypothetical protein